MQACKIWDPRQLPVLLTTEQTAQLLGVCKKQVCRLCVSGEIPAVRVGKSVWRIKKAELLQKLQLQEE